MVDGTSNSSLKIIQIPRCIPRNLIFSGNRFINIISGDHQLEEPKQFFGGIIADPMGFGKTLTMIALVAASAQGHNGENLRLQGSSNDVENNNPTLIVVPPPCMFSFMPFFVRFIFNDGVSVGYLGGTAFTVRTMISECSISNRRSLSNVL